VSTTLYTTLRIRLQMNMVVVL